MSVGLAVALGDLSAPNPIELIDCDVEAPNDHLYLRCADAGEEPVLVPVPFWAPEGCTACGACARACEFSGLTLLGDRVEVFPERCHSCGACTAACPTGALTEGVRRVGVVRSASSPGVALRWGELDAGATRAAPVIQAARHGRRPGSQRVLDGPPGSSCSLVAAARGADMALLVTEPTPFGLHDLELAWRAVTLLGVPSAVVLNKAQRREGRIHSFCRARGVPILLEIPLDRDLAQAGARGVPLPVADPAYGPVLRGLWSCLETVFAPRRAV